MSGKGKAKDALSAARAASTGKTARAGLIFPVGRIGRWIKEGSYASRVGTGAPIFLAAVLEYLTTEVLEIAGGQAKETNKRRIHPQHIQYAVRGDQELAELLSNVTISEGGVFSAAAELPPMKQKATPTAPEAAAGRSRPSAPADEQEF